MNIIQDYLQEVQTQINKLAETQGGNIEKAGKAIAESLKQDGRLYAFGTGHSHMVVEEFYIRAGGLAPVIGILEPELMVHETAHKSTFIERLEGYSEPLLELYHPEPQDVIVIISNSGRNAVTVEMATAAKKKGMTVIAITSLTHSSSVESRHSSGKRLFEVADIVIDTLTPLGDAGYYVEGVEAPVGAMSDIMGVTIAQAIVVKVTELLSQEGIEVPIYYSANVDGSKEKNRHLNEKYSNFRR